MYLFLGLAGVFGAVGLASTVAVRPKRRTRGGHFAADQTRRVMRATWDRDRRLRSARVSVVVPALNEEACIGWVLERIPEWVSEVILVDGRSTDVTEIVARGLVPDLVVVHQPRAGKGAALRAGFAAATGDIIAMIDADGSTNPAELGRFVKALLAGAEFVKGSRHLPDGGSEDLTLLRTTGNRVFVGLTNLMYGSRFTDLCYGYCAFWRRDLPALGLEADGFEIETELVVRALKAGLRVSEVPSFELNRLAGESNLNAFRDGRRVLRKIIGERVARSLSAAPTRAEVELVPVELAAPGHKGWMPAGKDQRWQDRRLRDGVAAGYTGPERRRGDRRERPLTTVTVYRAIERQLASEGQLGIGDVLVPQPAEEAVAFAEAAS